MAANRNKRVTEAEAGDAIVATLAAVYRLKDALAELDRIANTGYRDKRPTDHPRRAVWISDWLVISEDVGGWRWGVEQIRACLDCIADRDHIDRAREIVARAEAEDRELASV